MEQHHEQSNDGNVELSTAMNVNRARCRMATLVFLILPAGRLQAQQENATQVKGGAIPAASNASTPATTGASSHSSERERRLLESRAAINTADGSLGVNRSSLDDTSSAASREDAAPVEN